MIGHIKLLHTLFIRLCRVFLCELKFNRLCDLVMVLWISLQLLLFTSLTLALSAADYYISALPGLSWPDNSLKMHSGYVRISTKSHPRNLRSEVISFWMSSITARCFFGMCSNAILQIDNAQSSGLMEVLAAVLW